LFYQYSSCRKRFIVELVVSTPKLATSNEQYSRGSTRAAEYKLAAEENTVLCRGWKVAGEHDEAAEGKGRKIVAGRRGELAELFLPRAASPPCIRHSWRVAALQTHHSMGERSLELVLPGRGCSRGAKKGGGKEPVTCFCGRSTVAELKALLG
jgi:hypothetical protein